MGSVVMGSIWSQGGVCPCLSCASRLRSGMERDVVSALVAPMELIRRGLAACLFRLAGMAMCGTPIF